MLLHAAFIALLTRNPAKKSDHQRPDTGSQIKRSQRVENRAREGRREPCIPWTPVEMFNVRWFGLIPTCFHVFLLIESSASVFPSRNSHCAESGSGPEDRLTHHDLRLSHLWLNQYYFPLETTNGLSVIPVPLPNHSSQRAQQALGCLTSSIRELAELFNWL